MFLVPERLPLLLLLLRAYRPTGKKTPLALRTWALNPNPRQENSYGTVDVGNKP
jgi:hypothetical protein